MPFAEAVAAASYVFNCEPSDLVTEESVVCHACTWLYRIESVAGDHGVSVPAFAIFFIQLHIHHLLLVILDDHGRYGSVS